VPSIFHQIYNGKYDRIKKLSIGEGRNIGMKVDLKSTTNFKFRIRKERFLIA
jgi:hypothetical protein